MGIKSFFQDKVIWPLVKSVIIKKLKGSNIMEWLKGKKSYIVAIVGVVINGLWAMGYIDDSSVKMIDSILASLFGITIAAKINRNNK